MTVAWSAAVAVPLGWAVFGRVVAPDGNDAVLLNAVPVLAQHALPAYAMMLLGVAAGLMLRRGRSPAVSVRPALG